MRFYSFIFCLLVPMLALAVVDEELNFFVPHVSDFEKVRGGQPANQLFLEDGTKVWVHGCKIGSVVTIKGETAPAGEYKVQDIDIILKVDQAGKIEEPINSLP